VSAPRSGLYAWLDERLSLSALAGFARHKTVPVHRWAAIYYLGGMTLFFFLVQVLTGILLMVYYRPSAAEAFESVELIMTDVAFGWLIRSIHSWSANLMIFFAALHLVSVYFAKAYRAPRELTWVTGCVALFIALGFGFSGYLLPWDELAYFATRVGTQIPATIPVVGEWIMRFLRGGDRVTSATISRFYGWHVAILPALMVAVLALHLLLVQLLGMSVPPAAEDEARRRRPMRFFPHYALRDLLGWLVALGVLGALAALFPWELGNKADAFAPAPKDIRPEWYFVFMFETLKFVPGGSIFGLEYEAIPILGFGVGALLLVLVPFLDRGVMRRGRSPGFTAVGVVALTYMVVVTCWGYRSLVPLYAILGGAALVWLFALAIEHGEPGGDG
jgi:quinol-cytochrome oxidoreductase complex cytochrome b subunit